VPSTAQPTHRFLTGQAGAFNHLATLLVRLKQLNIFT